MLPAKHYFATSPRVAPDSRLRTVRLGSSQVPAIAILRPIAWKVISRMQMPRRIGGHPIHWHHLTPSTGRLLIRCSLPERRTKCGFRSILTDLLWLVTRQTRVLGQHCGTYQVHHNAVPRMHWLMPTDRQQYSIYKQGAGQNADAIYPDGNIYQPQPTESDPMFWQKVEPDYTWDPSEQLMPRHKPGSRTNPWSAYEMLNHHFQQQPSSDESLFALETSDDASLWASHASSSTQVLTPLRHPVSQPTATPSFSPSHSDECDDTIDRPPPGNPVGPPPQILSQGTKQRNLTPAQREKAARMREYGTCWHCAILKYPVSFIPAHDMSEDL